MTQPLTCKNGKCMCQGRCVSLYRILKRVHGRIHSNRMHIGPPLLATKRMFTERIFPLSPISHSLTHVVLNSPPPKSELSLTVCSPPCSLSQFTEVWQALPVSLKYQWVMKSLKNGYTLLFFCRLLSFNGVLMSTVWERNASVLWEEIQNILAKCAVEAVPLKERESGFYSRYFLVPNKDGGLRPILDQMPLNHALSKRWFKMITLR